MALEESNLPVKNVVLFIAVGALVFIIIFIFAKRQITRFALKSSRGPHMAIGYDAPKMLKQEIERRLNRVRYIKYEPELLRCEKEEELMQVADTDTCHYFYRMKAIDAIKLLDEELKKNNLLIRRSAEQNVREFLLELKNKGPLQSAKIVLIRSFADAYDHARHDPEIFGRVEFINYMDLLNEILICIQTNSEKKGGSESSIPSETPLLDSVENQKDFTDHHVTYRPSHQSNNTGATRLVATASSHSSHSSLSRAGTDDDNIATEKTV